MTEPERFAIIINGQRHDVSQSSLTGLQVRVLSGAGPEFDIIVEGFGEQHDRPLNENEAISLLSGPVHVYLKPPTSFGSP